MKNVKLRDLLTDEQLVEVEQIIKIATPSTLHALLRAYLVAERASLEAKGVVPEYLAYVIEYHCINAQGQLLSEERKNAAKN